MLHVAQVQLAAGQARRAHAQKRNVRTKHSRVGIGSGMKTTCLVGLRHELAHARFDDWAAAGFHHLDLDAIQIHTYNPMPHVSKARSRDRPDVTQSKNADRQTHAMTPRFKLKNVRRTHRDSTPQYVLYHILLPPA